MFKIRSKAVSKQWWSQLSAAVGATFIMLATAFPVFGQQASDTALTFADHVAPIIYDKCVECHRPGSIAPMSLIDYATVRAWAPIIKDRVINRKMPPYFIDKTVGIQRFKDDRSLTDEQIATIARWVDGGASEGDPDNLPPVPSFTDNLAWTIEGEMGRPPDLIVPIPEPFTVPPNSPNWWMTFYSDTGLTEDRWIQAFETKPSADGFPVVHHAVTSMEFPEGGGGFLSEYALGKTSDINPPGTGQLIKAGTRLRWNIHYASSPDGQAHTDKTRLALWFLPEGEEPEHVLVRSHMADNEDLDLPGGEESIRTDGYEFLDKNIRITTFQPHLHNLGTRQCIEVIYQDNRRQTLSCAFWDFGWHIAYHYAEEVQPLIPKGSMLHVTSWYNNSNSNPWASDSRNWVGFGQRSTDDMSFSWISYYDLTDEEYEEAVSERMAQMVSSND
ncbi:MAG: cytochrome c [Proteobacteria bacterium]|nr:cytochrome c [Pseudomonadota bacterium]